MPPPQPQPIQGQARCHGPRAAGRVGQRTRASAPQTCCGGAGTAFKQRQWQWQWRWQRQRQWRQSATRRGSVPEAPGQGAGRGRAPEEGAVRGWVGLDGEGDKGERDTTSASHQCSVQSRGTCIEHQRAACGLSRGGTWRVGLTRFLVWVTAWLIGVFVVDVSHPSGRWTEVQSPPLEACHSGSPAASFQCVGAGWHRCGTR